MYQSSASFPWKTAVTEAYSRSHLLSDQTRRIWLQMISRGSLRKHSACPRLELCAAFWNNEWHGLIVNSQRRCVLAERTLPAQILFYLVASPTKVYLR